MLDKIEKILDEKVRPELRSHGGDIKLLGFEDGIMRFSLLGQCAGCPAADLTTEGLIREAVLSALPEVKEVVLVRQISQDLLDQAMKILRKQERDDG